MKRASTWLLSLMLGDDGVKINIKHAAERVLPVMTLASLLRKINNKMKSYKTHACTVLMK